MISRLGKNQIETIIELRRDQQKEDWGVKYPEDDTSFIQATATFFENRLNKDIYGFGCCVDGKIVSVCYLQLIEYLPQVNDITGVVGYICNVYTVPEFRKKGYQTLVFEACLKFAQSKNVNLYELSTDNPIAIKIYKSFGFKPNRNAMCIK